MKELNICETGASKNEWSSCGPINQGMIAGKVKDKTTKNGKALNAVPSPLARLYVVNDAFSMLTYDLLNKTSNCGECYKFIVSDCLDVFELLFNLKYHEDKKEEVKVRVWNKQKGLKELRSVDSQNLADSLEGYLTDNSFGEMDEFILIKYKNQILAGSSPFTFLFTTPNLDKYEDRSFMNPGYQEHFNLINPNTKKKYFTGIRLFEDRDALFQKYVLSIVEQCASDHIVNFRNYIKYWAQRVNLSTIDMVQTKPVLSEDNSNVHINGVEICKSTGINSMNFFTDHLIKVRFKIDTENFVCGSYVNDKEERNYDYLLPLRVEALNSVDYQNLKVEFQESAKEVKVMLTLPGENKQKSQIYRKQISTGDAEEKYTIIALEEYVANVNLGIFPFLQVIDADDKPTSENDYFKVMLTIADANKKMPVSLYNLTFFRKVNDFYQPIQEVDKNESMNIYCTRYERRMIDENSDLGSIYYQVNNTTFSLIRLSFPVDFTHKADGLVIPKWNKKKIGPRDFHIAVDFGTTNTFIAFTGDNGIKPKPFEITPDDRQVVMLHSPADNEGNDKKITSLYEEFFGFDESTLDVQASEFIPSVIMSRGNEKYNFPIRTALCEKNNESGELKLLDNSNISFTYEKREIRKDQVIVSNIKWSEEDKDKERVSIFINEILRMVKYKIILNGGNPELTKMTWFNPLSFSQTAKENYKQMWKNNYTTLFGEKAELFNVTESEAPYYYYKNAGMLDNNNSVLTVDIGGGSTDFMIFKNEIPVRGTSVNFACNDLWRNGYNSFSNVKENGIYKSIQKRITDNFKSTNLNGLNKQYQTNEKYSSAEIINFWFANENASRISDLLSNGVYKKVFLFHLSALMFHAAQFMKDAGEDYPSCIIFSGNGSKYIDLLSRNKNIIGEYCSYIFQSIFGEKGRKVQIVLPETDRKESTCYGGLYKDNSVRLSNSLFVGCEISYEDKYRFHTYKDVRGEKRDELKNSIIENVKEFIQLYCKMFVELHLGREFNENINLKAFEGILISKVEGYYNNGFSKYTKGQADEAELSETLFFYPIVGLIDFMTGFTKDDLDLFINKEVYYAKNMDGNGFFFHKNLSKEQRLDSIYRIMVETEKPTVASLSLITSDNISSKMIPNVENWIKPFLDFEEYPTSDCKIVKEIEPARLHLNENKWEVQTKGKVVFK